MINTKTNNIVDVSKGCIDTMINRGWTECKSTTKPAKKSKTVALEAKQDGKS